MQKALVFAGRSFIGQWLVQGLRNRGWTVISTAGRTPQVELEACDLLDAGQVSNTLERVRPDWVFQCAGATKANDARYPFQLHVAGALNVLDAVRRYVPDAGVILLGSAAEYGSPDPENIPTREDSPCRPLSFFGASKLAQTELARVAASEWRLRITVARPFNVIGPGQPEQYFAASFASRLERRMADLTREPLSIANADATRDFLDVRDVVEAMIRLTQIKSSESGKFEVYNIASGQETSLRQVAEELCRLAGEKKPLSQGVHLSRGGSQRSCGSATKLREATGWWPKYTWEASLRDFWQTRITERRAA